MAEKCSPTSEQSPFTGDSACDWQFNFVCSCFWRFYKFLSFSLPFSLHVSRSAVVVVVVAHILPIVHHCTVSALLYSWNEQRERPWYVTGWHLLCSFWPPLPSVAATAAGSVLSLSLALTRSLCFSFRCWPMDNRGVMAVWIKSSWPAGRLSRFTIHMRTFYFICGVYVVGADALSGPWPYSYF